MAKTPLKILAYMSDKTKQWVDFPSAAHPSVIQGAVQDYLSAHPVTVDQSGKVDKVTGSSLVPDAEIAKIHAAGSDNQDLSGLQPKETGKGLSTNDYTTEEKNKLAGLSSGLTQQQIEGII